MKRVWIVLAIASTLVIVYALSMLYQYLAVTGTPVIISENPRRIISISPNLTEIVFALGLGDKVAGVSSNCNYPPETAEKPTMGSFWQPNTEAIIAAKPDLVVTERFEQHNTAAEAVRRAGINVVAVRVETLAELFAAIKTIAVAAGCTDKGQQLTNALHEQLKTIRQKYNAVQKVRVLWVVENEPLRVAGRNTFVNELISLAGGENIVPESVQQYPELGGEALLGCKAEVIIHSAMGATDLAAQQRKAEEFWSKYPAVPAVKDNRIHVIQPDNVLRLGPRVAEGAKTIAELLHPELKEQAATGGQVR